MISLNKFPFYQQLDAMDCGPTSLRIIAKYYGRIFTLQTLRDYCCVTREGVSLMGIIDAAEKIGLRTLPLKPTLKQLYEELPLPCIIHWNNNHFLVVYKVTKDKVYVSDPAHGLLVHTKEEFLKGWTGKSDEDKPGIALLLETTPKFYEDKDEELNTKKGLAYFFQYILKYKKFLVQILFGMIAGSILQLVTPFLTQSLVDYGIGNRDIDFIYLILIAQVMLFLGNSGISFIRSWIMLHMGSRINISIISDFLIKLMRLPISYFDSKMIGDIMQRIGDHSRIQSFLTSTPLTVLFSLIDLVVYSIILAYYDAKIFMIFMVSSVLYVIWILLFMKKRRDLDFKRFNQSAGNSSKMIELISGMQEIKLNNAEKQKRWQWEHVQAKMFKISMEGMSLGQAQQAGSMFINQLSGILISFYTAKLVVDGALTLGMMMAVSFVIGKLSGPVSQFIGLIQSAQDARISLERLNEIHLKEDEDTDINKSDFLPENPNIYLNNISFQYGGAHTEFVLKDLDLVIPHKKITAIVGTSGSGKTTLLKLLLGFYQPTQGEIKIEDMNLSNVSTKTWRDKCGVVMQEGYVFSDTIANNIAIGVDVIDKERLMKAVKIANIKEFIEKLPLGYNTKIGREGNGISGGQRQRILIARAVYKNPEIILFDEATSALDTNNESIIMKNLEEFFKGRTAVIIAHRLSTVMNADQIVVLDKGKIIEMGNHRELVDLQGSYFKLVKNQLNLGN